MDELLALFEEHPPDEQSKDDGKTSRNGTATTSNSQSAQDSIEADDEEVEALLSRGRKTTTDDPKESSTGVDMETRLGTRVVERQISSLDMLEITNRSYFVSTPSLAAMSLKHLNRYLTEPAAVLDAATVCGRTMLTTVGVVMEASQTCLTKSGGKAFCKVGLGTLRTGGSCISVLLFGAAYSSNMQSADGRRKPRCTPGTVVALHNPRILPQQSSSSNSGDTALTLSINDPQQLVLVGRDGDFGYCQATVSGKNAQGQWVSNAKQCSHVIDKRQGPYCAKHRNCKHMVSSSSSGGKTMRSATGGSNSKKGSLLQQMRNERSQMAIAAPTMASKPNTNLASLARNTAPLRQGQLVQPQPRTNLSLVSQTTKTQPALHNRGLVKSQTKQPPPHSRMVTPPNRSLAEHFPPPPRTQHPCNTQPSRVPVTEKSRRNKPGLANQSTQSKLHPSGSVDLHSLLMQGTSSRTRKRTEDHIPQTQTAQTKRPRPRRSPQQQGGGAGKRNTALLNTDTTGFDGAVAIPQPSSMFQRGAKVLPPQQPTVSSTATVDPHAERLQQEILTRQAQVAERLQREQEPPSINSAEPKRRVASSAHVSKDGNTTKGRQRQQDRTDRLFGSLTQAEIDQAAQRTSLFASEVHAEAYAQHRRAVVELEKEEERKTGQSKENKKGNKGLGNGIVTEWHCRDCGKVFRNGPHPPFQCQRNGHSLTRKRIVASSRESVAEGRQALNDRSNAHGTTDVLTLGSGLEWSRWNLPRFG